MRFPFFRNRDSVKNGILISIRRTGDGFHPGLFNYALAYKAAIPKSTLLNIIHGTNPTIETIQKICGGFDISLGTFFNTDYFYEIYDDE
ncbi:MAG: helix-turn-helix domain-containing protein [Blautia wexlerae]